MLTTDLHQLETTDSVLAGATSFDQASSQTALDIKMDMKKSTEQANGLMSLLIEL